MSETKNINHNGYTYIHRSKLYELEDKNQRLRDKLEDISRGVVDDPEEYAKQIK